MDQFPSSYYIYIYTNPEFAVVRYFQFIVLSNFLASPRQNRGEKKDYTDTLLNQDLFSNLGK